jgi:hypothetical protein
MIFSHEYLWHVPISSIHLGLSMRNQDFSKTAAQISPLIQSSFCQMFWQIDVIGVQKILSSN